MIHIVQENETIQTIADKYGVSAARLVLENDLTESQNLVVGQTIVVVYPLKTYVVQEGDTLESIANANDVSVLQLLRNNPYILDTGELFEGETIVISYTNQKIRDITVNGYCFPFAEKNMLQKNLLFLTYLSIYSYIILPDGDLVDIDDIDIINLARSYGVAPIMVISNNTQNSTTGTEVIHNILNSEYLRNNIIVNALRIVKTKGYYGINIDTPYIREEDREEYYNFISNITDTFNQEGYQVFATITPDTYRSETEFYEKIDYSVLANIVNGVTLISYDWGKTAFPVGIIPFYVEQTLLESALTQIPPEKTSIGISNIGYVLSLPYETGVSRVSSISVTNAVQLASNVGVEIKHNSANLLSYFYILNNENYLVFFHDARAIETYVSLVPKLGLKGIGIWNVMNFLPQTFLVINTDYNIINMVYNF